MDKQYPERHPRVSFPLIEPPTDLDLMPDRTQFLIDRSLLARKWRLLDEVTEAFVTRWFGLTPHAPPFSLNPLIGQFEAISVRPSLEITVSYQGGPCDGNLGFHTVLNGKEQDMLAALEVRPSIAGFIEALYLAFQIRTKCASWHGLYGRDFTLLPNYFMLRRPRSWVPPEQYRPQYLEGKVDRPVGIRVAKRRGRYYLSCMALYAGGTIADMTARVADGNLIYLWPPETVYRSEVKIVY